MATQTVTLKWDLPTTVGGGSAVPAGDSVAGVNVYLAPNTSTPFASFPGAVTSGQVNLSPGQYVFTFAVVDNGGQVGNQGLGFIVTVPNPTPPKFDPPSNYSFTLS